MFGRDPYTPKPESLFEPRLLSTTSINQVLPATIIGEKRTQELYHESYFWWMNLANSITIVWLPYIDAHTAKTSPIIPPQKRQIHFGTPSTQIQISA